MTSEQFAKESGVAFPITRREALRYRGVGHATVERWEEKGLILPPKPEEHRRWRTLSKQISKLEVAIKFHEERLNSARRRLSKHMKELHGV